jgi:hypothetical protein
VVLTLGLELGRSARAQSATDSATAESLFNEALTLLSSEHAAEACPKLEESQRLDPGVGTLLYLADCYRRLGRSASAWATFREASYLAKDRGDERETVAIDFARKLEPQLSYLTLKITPQPGVALDVEHDGKRMGEALWNTAIPVDPGMHHLRLSAPGKQTWSTDIEVSAGPARAEVELPALDAVLPEPPPSAAPPPRPLPAMPAQNQRQWISWTLIGVGSAGILGGGVLALLAHADDKDAAAHCRPDIRILCDASGVKLGGQAKTQAALAGVSSAIGIAALGTGVVLLLTTPAHSTPDQTPTLALGTRLSADGGEISFYSSW